MFFLIFATKQNMHDKNQDNYVFDSVAKTLI